MKDKRILFASDFHLSPKINPEIVSLFLSFLDQKVKGADALYLLGDVFDFWVGSGMLTQGQFKEVFIKIQALTQAGVHITMLHGNRDFLLSPAEERHLGVVIPGESTKITLDRLKVYLSHGDDFCTNDKPYQRMKRIIRSNLIRLLARAVPTGVAVKAAMALRGYSRKAVKAKEFHTMDLSLEALKERFSQDIDVIICGHIHRSDDKILFDQKRLITLSSWDKDGGDYAEFSGNRLRLKRFS